MLVGTKFDLFYTQEDAVKAPMIKKARKFAKSMKAPLVFVASSHGINVSKLFKLVRACRPLHCAAPRTRPARRATGLLPRRGRALHHFRENRGQ